MSPLEYVPTKTKNEGDFRISPSAFAEFITHPYKWYRSQVLEEKEFQYSTSTVIGTCVHYCAEQIAKDIPVDVKVINEYIDSLERHEDYDPQVVKDSYIAMAETLVNDYVNENSFLHVEHAVVSEVSKGFCIAGQADAIQGTPEDAMLVDYKTYNSKTKPKSIPIHYRYQLLVYAYGLSKMGIKVNRIRLVFVNRHIDGGVSEKTGRPLKSYPPEITVLTEVIEDDSLVFIKSMLDLAVESVEAAKKHPELTHVIFHDPRLKVET